MPVRCVADRTQAGRRYGGRADGLSASSGAHTSEMPDLQPEMDTRPSAEFRALALACLHNGDWYGAYRWAKGWIGCGGGHHIDPWLVYVASDLMHGKRAGATHALDMAMGLWLPGTHDRAALLWLRGCIVHRCMNDPRTALLDLRAAAPGLPDWLIDHRDAEIAACEEAARRSRKRVPAVKQAWSFTGRPDTSRIRDRADAYEPRSDGDAPDPRLVDFLVDLGLPVG